MAKRVIIALMDGVRPDAITQIRHPFFEKLTQEGSFCMTGRTVAPPRAFPAHISLFTSVDPGQHGIVTNDIRPFPRSFAGLMQILREAGKADRRGGDLGAALLCGPFRGYDGAHVLRRKPVPGRPGGSGLEPAGHRPHRLQMPGRGNSGPVCGEESDLAGQTVGASIARPQSDSYHGFRFFAQPTAAAGDS